MKKLLAFLLAAWLCAASALALTPEELGVILRENYAGEIPARVWEEETVEGMLAALGDPFSGYYTPQAYAAFLQEVDGQGEQSIPNAYRLENGVGWATLNTFGQGEELEAQVRSASVSHWVVDLRGNSGGELRAAVDAMGLFAGGGNLVYLRDKEGKLYAGKYEETEAVIHRPAIVLVGGHTASAAELFAATLRDRQLGLLIGQRTYGKGVAQSAFDARNATYGAAFADGSALVLTTDLAFSEGLVSNNIVGVLPHLLVEPGQEEGVARLLTPTNPGGAPAGWLRLHLAQWRWYVDLDRADRAALGALLEALPPQVPLYLGTGGADWAPTTAQAVADRQGLTDYAPRRFPDVDDSPYADAIHALAAYGVVRGDKAGRFHPGQGLTRAALCALLAQAMDYPMSSAAPAFADTPADAWYTPYVTTLSALGIVNGYDDGLFHPDDPIPHQQFMTILARTAASLHHTSWRVLAVGPDAEALADGDYLAYDPWAVPGAWLLDGAWHAPARDIDPRGVTTREEAAYDLWSMLQVLGVLQV